MNSIRSCNQWGFQKRIVYLIFTIPIIFNENPHTFNIYNPQDGNDGILGCNIYNSWWNMVLTIPIIPVYWNSWSMLTRIPGKSWSSNLNGKITTDQARARGEATWDGTGHARIRKLKPRIRKLTGTDSETKEDGDSETVIRKLKAQIRKLKPWIRKLKPQIRKLTQTRIRKLWFGN